jgi:hypothetical protein
LLTIHLIRAVDEIRKATACIAVQHPEVHDTDVREQIACSLDRVFHAAGLMPLSGI